MDVQSSFPTRAADASRAAGQRIARLPTGRRPAVVLRGAAPGDEGHDAAGADRLAAAVVVVAALRVEGRPLCGVAGRPARGRVGRRAAEAGDG